MKKIYMFLAAFLCCTSLFAEEGKVENAPTYNIPGEVSALGYSAYNWIPNKNYNGGAENPAPVIEGDHLGFTQVGDWFDYKVNVAKAGDYWMQVYGVRGNTDNGGHFKLSVDGKVVKENILVVHEANNWGNFDRFTQYKVTLPVGEHILRVELTGEFNFQKLAFSTEKVIVTGPYGGKPAKVPGIIKFGEYDEGLENVVWGKPEDKENDDKINIDGGRHAREDSRIIVDDGGNLGFTITGEWAKHTIDASKAGKYKVWTSGANGNGGETELLLTIDDANYTLKATGSTSWSDYVKSNVVELELTKGEHTLIWKVGDKAGNWNYIEFEYQVPADLTNTPYDITKTVVPGEFSALLFDEGGEGIAYHDDTEEHLGGNTFRNDEGVDFEGTGEDGNLSHTNGGEWILYTIDVKEAGKYKVSLQMSSGNQNDGGNGWTAGVNFDKKDTDARDINFILPNDNCTGWGEYQYMKGDVEVELTKGLHVMKWMTDGGANVKSFKFEKTGETSGINSVNADNGIVTFYNLQGMRVDNAGNGVVIRVKNGKAVKVIK